MDMSAEIGEPGRKVSSLKDAWTDVLVENRDEFVDHLQAKNIDCRKFWHPLHTQEPYKSSKETFPVATELAPKALWLPSAFTLDDEDIAYISKMIRKFF